MRYAPALLFARLLRWGIRRVRKGGGSALPGVLLARLAPGILYRVLSSFRDGLVVITGSAGKSTTTKMAVAILEAHGVEVFTNPTTANILQGFYSTIAAQASLSGKVRGQVAVLEMDEGHAAELVSKVKPKHSVILNVVEDQLDRFVDPAYVAEKLLKVAQATTGTVHLNADDQNLVAFESKLATGAKPPRSDRVVIWFGLDEVIANHGRGLGYAPTYSAPLARPAVQTQVFSLQDRATRVKTSRGELGFALPARGSHFAVDAVAAISLCETLLAEPDLALFAKTLDEIPPVFARGEIIEVEDQRLELVLVQNPASTQLNIDALSSNLECIYFGIGRDVHDPSWLWTVTLPDWRAVAITAGYNANEAALFLKYSGVEPGQVIPDDIPASLEAFLALPAPSSGIKTLIISADVMRRIRRHLGFETPEAVRQ